MEDFTDLSEYEGANENETTNRFGYTALTVHSGVKNFKGFISENRTTKNLKEKQNPDGDDNID